MNTIELYSTPNSEAPSWIIKGVIDYSEYQIKIEDAEIIEKGEEMKTGKDFFIKGSKGEMKRISVYLFLGSMSQITFNRIS